MAGAEYGLREKADAIRARSMDGRPRIAVDADVLERCEYHGEVYDAQAGDNAPAYMRGNRLFSSGELNGVFSDRRDMTDTIKAVIEDSAMECGYCAKMRSE